MVYDAHTPCPVCPIQVRHLHECTTVLALLLEHALLPEDIARLLAEPLAGVKLSLEMLRPFMEAHRANQLHAWSPELQGSRAPGEPEDMGDQQLALLPLDARD